MAIEAGRGVDGHNWSGQLLGAVKNKHRFSLVFKKYVRIDPGYVTPTALLVENMFFTPRVLRVSV